MSLEGYARNVRHVKLLENLLMDIYKIWEDAKSLTCVKSKCCYYTGIHKEHIITKVGFHLKGEYDIHLIKNMTNQEK